MIRVMLIDDHPVVRAGLRTILDAFDDIEVVAEGAEGSAALTATTASVDVVVCDIQMPGMDGITATRRLAETGGPPVLILTTYDTEADIVAAVEAGALGYLLKDAPEQALHDAVVTTAQGRRTLSPEVAAALAERVSRPRQALSTREIEILRALESGAGNRDLARQLFISEATVKTHLVHIYQKLGVENRTAAITAARERRLI
ncbi:response regulator [Corynebacterium halotolerans]|uniref:Two-component system response regulator involved in heme homeostasis n=1 Tax=Corynebacterium halotolerans YIM 70093 = DSM 44683 TaxID=1121362 RepID=M1N1D5_9CORY|nr:response regulator transcription factor [Corynebacterium halotolerans]AGF73739.1 two-component system response regulator involved in heme homeostasis [Corynebacterium halotolerans YIM 70093 = DSM 44683]